MAFDSVSPCLLLGLGFPSVMGYKIEAEKKPFPPQVTSGHSVDHNRNEMRLAREVLAGSQLMQELSECEHGLFHFLFQTKNSVGEKVSLRDV